MYAWEGYQAQIYEHFQGDRGGPEQQLQLLQAAAQKAAGADHALPPGFRAHMGLVYLRMGRVDEAMQQFQAEKTAFPESAPYMDFLMKPKVPAGGA